MISNPRLKECDLKIGDFEAHPLSTTDVVGLLLHAFINYEETGKGMAFFEYGDMDTFSLILTLDSKVIIEEKETLSVHDFSESNFADLEKELIDDIESNVDAWVSFSIKNQVGGSEEEYKEDMLHDLSALKRLIQ